MHADNTCPPPLPPLALPVRVLLLVHDTKPPFLDGRFLFTKQKGALPRVCCPAAADAAAVNTAAGAGGVAASAAAAAPAAVAAAAAAMKPPPRRAFPLQALCCL